MSDNSIKDLVPATILDLTHRQTLYELSIEESELLGPIGAKLIADLKERAFEADYTHMYFRDPIRPGIVWFTPLGGNPGLEIPTRGRLDQTRQIAEKVFGGFLSELEQLTADIDEGAENNDTLIMSQIPPLVSGVSGLELATALEYIVFVYPAMVRAWAALIFAYDQIIGLREGADSARQACLSTCTHAQLVPYLMGDDWGNQNGRDRAEMDCSES